MEFDDLIARLEELRTDAARERFAAAAHQLEAWISYLRLQPRIFSPRAPDIYQGDEPQSEEAQ